VRQSVARLVKDAPPRGDRVGEPLDEVERRLGDLAPAVVDRDGWPRFEIFTISVRCW
jgi:hypothetical protein